MMESEAGAMPKTTKIVIETTISVVVITDYLSITIAMKLKLSAVSISRANKALYRIFDDKISKHFIFQLPFYFSADLFGITAVLCSKSLFEPILRQQNTKSASSIIIPRKQLVV